MSDAARIGIFTSGLWRLRREVAVLTGMTPVRRFLSTRGLDAVAGWGFKPTARRARGLAAAAGLPYFAIEDGFLRSLRPGRANPSMSYVVDRLGIYYDSFGPSEFERLALRRALDPAAARRVAAPAIAALREIGLSKYNAFSEAPELLSMLDVEREGNVLVVDQTRGDAAVSGAGADAGRFVEMLLAALQDNPGRRIAIRGHPGADPQGRSGYLSVDALRAAPEAARRALDAAADRIVRCPPAAAPWALLPRIRRVYAVSSLMGFEALIHGAEVSCFGCAFYAGWGLTDDRVSMPARRGAAPLEALVAAAYVDYTRYIAPATGDRITLEAAVAALAAQRRAAAPAP